MRNLIKSVLGRKMRGGYGCVVNSQESGEGGMGGLYRRKNSYITHLRTAQGVGSPKREKEHGGEITKKESRNNFTFGWPCHDPK